MGKRQKTADAHKLDAKIETHKKRAHRAHLQADSAFGKMRHDKAVSQDRHNNVFKRMGASMSRMKNSWTEKRNTKRFQSEQNKVDKYTEQRRALQPVAAAGSNVPPI